MNLRLPVVCIDDCWTVNVPSFQMLPGTFLPIAPGLIDGDGVLVEADPAAAAALNPSVICEVPDADCDTEAGTLNIFAMRRRYSLPPDYVAPVALPLAPEESQ